MNAVPLSKLVFHIVVGLIGYSALAAVFIATKSSPELKDIITALKIVSLFALCVANIELSLKLHEKKDLTLKWVNQGIVIFAIILIVILLARFYNANIENSKDISPEFSRILAFILNYSMWFSIIPLAAYALVDASIIMQKSRSEEERATARRFMIFNDLVCILPLILISIVGLIAYVWVGANKDEVESLINGALAVTLLASATATKAIEMYYE